MADWDGDGIPDVQERAEGTDPYDAKSHCFGLSVVEHGVVRTTNYLSAAVMFGDAAVYGPVFATNRTFAADVGHLVATNGEPVVLCFWDDANSNGVRDAGETSTPEPSAGVLLLLGLAALSLRRTKQLTPSGDRNSNVWRCEVTMAMPRKTRGEMVYYSPWRERLSEARQYASR